MRILAGIAYVQLAYKKFAEIKATSGTARFFSPLGVDSFIKRSSYIYYTREALLDAVIIALASLSCSACDIRSAARYFGLAVSSASTSISLGPAIMLAPEHLEVVTKNPMEYIGRLDNVGSLFLGENIARSDNLGNLGYLICAESQRSHRLRPSREIYPVNAAQRRSDKDILIRGAVLKRRGDHDDTTAFPTRRYRTRSPKPTSNAPILWRPC